MPKQSVKRNILKLAAIAAVCVFPSIASAASATWNQSTPGIYSWDTNAVTNWLGGLPADGQAATADFNSINLTGDITVNLDTTSHTIGNLIFGDTDTSSTGSWIIGGASTLTLDNTGGSG